RANMTPFSMTRNADMTGPCTMPPGVSRTHQALPHPRAESGFMTSPLPRASRKGGLHRWSARWAGQGQLCSLPRQEKGSGGQPENSCERALLPATLRGAEGILVFRGFGVAGAVVAVGFGVCEYVFDKRWLPRAGWRGAR